jgi:hypothetical protein
MTLSNSFYEGALSLQQSSPATAGVPVAMETAAAPTITAKANAKATASFFIRTYSDPNPAISAVLES